MSKEINKETPNINVLAGKITSKGITSNQGVLELGIERDTDAGGVGMGVLSDGTPYLNQRGLAALCGVQNAHIGTISSQWAEPEQKPRIQSIKLILSSSSIERQSAHHEIIHKGQIHYCYPAEVCLAILEYYAFDAGSNIQPEARTNFRKLAGTKLRDLIYSTVGYDPARRNDYRFDKWHERISLNYQSAPRGFFHVFNEANTIIYELIVAGAEINEHMIVDISIGIAWGRFWAEKNYDSLYGSRNRYPHKYPSDHPQALSNPQESWCYPVNALGEYRRWLQDEYIEGGKFKTYLQNKVRQGGLSPSVAELAITALAPPQIEGPQ